MLLPTTINKIDFLFIMPEKPGSKHSTCQQIPKTSPVEANIDNVTIT